MAAYCHGIVGCEHMLALGPQQLGRRSRTLGRRIESPAEMFARMAEADADAMVGEQDQKRPRLSSWSVGAPSRRLPPR